MRIIINADDFGKSIERNRAIDDSFKQGLIHSAGLIVTGQFAQSAVNKANEGGYLSHLHIHFNLTANMRIENSNDRPLTEAMRKDPFFCKEGRFLFRDPPSNFSSIKKCRTVYDELVAQFERFKEITDGKANYKHIDFHLWYNLTWPVSLALNRFTRRYKIESVRYCGLHQMDNRMYRLFRLLSWDPHVVFIPATNIDYYLSKRQTLSGMKIIELYCHPNFKEGVFLDDSPSYLNHDRQPMQKQIEDLTRIEDTVFVSWEDIRKK